jgi:hypothetical protein
MTTLRLSYTPRPSYQHAPYAIADMGSAQYSTATTVCLGFTTARVACSIGSAELKQVLIQLHCCARYQHQLQLVLVHHDNTGNTLR